MAVLRIWLFVWVSIILTTNLSFHVRAATTPKPTAQPSTASPTSQFPSRELNALFDLYNATNGDHWDWRKNVAEVGVKWDFAPNANPCAERWQGVFCNTMSTGSQSVIQLSLEHYELRGTIPESISNLVSLQDLNLTGNFLMGAIPPQIGNLTSLNYLKLGFNTLQGTIPHEITNCRELLILDLAGNALIGTIHESFVNFGKLQTLNLQLNRLGGTIPNLLGNLTALTYLGLSNNGFTGTLPQSLSQLYRLDNLILNSNFLNGTIPEEYANLTLLQQFVLSTNSLTGTIPARLGELTSLLNFNLGTNNLTGTIPAELGNLSQCLTFDLAHNQYLSGTLPESLTNLTKLDVLYLQNNAFYGTIPSFSRLKRLYLFDLSNNQFTGTLCDGLTQMTNLNKFNVANNRLHGKIPSGFGEVKYMNAFVLLGNAFNGTIPSSFNGSKNIVKFDLASNRLTGTVPPWLGQLNRMSALRLGGNLFTQTIPSEIGYLNKLSLLGLDDNLLTGTIPASLSNITLLETIALYSNHLTGTIPEAFSSLRALNALYLFNNSLTGTIPDFLSSLPVLQSIYLQMNAFTGSIPNTLQDLAILNQLFLFENQLTGTFPTALPQVDNKILQYIGIADNYLTGTIPSDINNLEVLFGFSVNNNYFTSTIPPQFGNVTFLKYFQLNYNLLTGTLPVELSNLRFLAVFFVQSNNLNGNLNGFVNATHQRMLTNIDVSNNQFTGHIPSEPFKISMMSTFAAVSNCLTGSIPLQICNAHKLTSLALDGISTATNCQHRYINSPLFAATYGLDSKLQQGIPSCLFNMTSLQTLHLSGNGITGSLSDDITIGTELRDLSLSYNVIGGTLPRAIQTKAWVDLDLSYNKITGRLSKDIYTPNNHSLLLKVNRLSGKIPQPLLSATNLEVLSGNIFDCSYSRTDKNTEIPTSDPDYLAYNCGSNNVDLALYFWMILVCGVLAFILLCHRAVYDKFAALQWFKLISQKYYLWLAIFQNKSQVEKQFDNIHILNVLIYDLKRMCSIIAAYLVLVAIPIYTALSYRYKSYFYEYAWVISAVYLSGFPPAFTVFVLSSVVLFYVLYNTVHKTKFLLIDEFALPKIETAKIHQLHVVALIIGAGVNGIITIGVNVGYVIVTLNYDINVVIMTQVGLSLFKIIWNEVLLRAMIYTDKYYNTLNGEPDKPINIILPTCMLLFNTIACPCLATLAISPDCFYNIIVTPDEVSASYQYQACNELQTNSLSVCTSYQMVTSTTSYAPPFNYSYQCSSALVSNYASIYVFMYLFKSFGMPLLMLVLKTAHTACYSDQKHAAAAAAAEDGYQRNTADTINSNKSSSSSSSNNNSSGGNTDKNTSKNTKITFGCVLKFGYVLNKVLPDFLRPISQLEAKSPRTIFYKEIFILRTINIVATFLTFGVMFPPVALVVAMALYSHFALTTATIGRLLAQAKDAGVYNKYHAIIDNDCKDISDLFWRSIYPVFPLSALFYSFFIYDSYGDVVGWRSALWLVILTMFMPIIIRLVLKIYEMRFPIVKRIIRKRRRRSTATTGRHTSAEGNNNSNTNTNSKRKSTFTSALSFAGNFMHEIFGDDNDNDDGDDEGTNNNKTRGNKSDNNTRANAMRTTNFSVYNRDTLASTYSTDHNSTYTTSAGNNSYSGAWERSRCDSDIELAVMPSNNSNNGSNSSSSSHNMGNIGLHSSSSNSYDDSYINSKSVADNVVKIEPVANNMVENVLHSPQHALQMKGLCQSEPAPQEQSPPLPQQQQQ